MSGKPIFGSITSRVASTAKPKPAGPGAFGWGLRAGSIALAIAAGFAATTGVGMPLAVAAAGGSVATGRAANGIDAKNEKRALTNWYRHQIAGQLGIAADQVSTRDLDLAAQVNPALGKMVQKIDGDHSTNNMSDTIGGALSAVPGVGIVAGMGAPFVPHLLNGNKNIVLDEVVTSINEKRQSGEQIEVGDVFMLRMAHDESLQKQIAEKHGARFQDMTPEQQQGVMMQMPEIMQASQREAYALNQGLISEQDLAMVTTEPASASFTNHMQPHAGAQSSFRAREEARRAQAAQAQQQLA